MNTEVTNEEPMKLWNKKFIMFLIGMEAYLIAFTLLFFAIPLYILLETGNPALMGTILGLSSASLIIVSPIGGALADRFSKRKVLATMNFIAAITIMIYIIIQGIVEMIPISMALLIMLSIFDGILSPTTESSVPLLVPNDKLVKANSISFLLMTVSSVGSPILAGFMMARFGITPILFVSIAFLWPAAVIKFFTPIPHTKQEITKSLPKAILSDTKEAICFVVKEKPEIGKVLLLYILAGITLFPLMNVGLPVLITIYLGMNESTLGITQGIIAFGGAIGSILIGILSIKANAFKARLLLLISSIALILTGITFIWSDNNALSYLILIGSFFIISAFNAMLGIITWAILGEKTPEEFMGKVFALLFSSVFLGLMIGNLLYGFLLNHFIESPGITLLIFSGLSIVIALRVRIKEKNVLVDENFIKRKDV